jgi:hypothetical protein
MMFVTLMLAALTLLSGILTVILEDANNTHGARVEIKCLKLPNLPTVGIVSGETDKLDLNDPRLSPGYEFKFSAKQNAQPEYVTYCDSRCRPFVKIRLTEPYTLEFLNGYMPDVAAHKFWEILQERAKQEYSR